MKKIRDIFSYIIKNRMAIIIILFSIFLTLVAVGPSANPVYVFTYLVVLALMASFMCLDVVANRRQFMKKETRIEQTLDTYYDRRLTEYIRERLKEYPYLDNSDDEMAKMTIDNKKIDEDIFVWMLENNKETTEYFKISKNQAKSSFWVSVISCIIGMGLLIFAILSQLIFKNVSMELSILSGIGGTIVEVVAGTTFWVHNKSALQLNLYYDALHDNEKFLSAVQLVDKLSLENRDTMLMEIIRYQLKTIQTEGQEVKSS